MNSIDLHYPARHGTLVSYTIVTGSKAWVEYYSLRTNEGQDTRIVL
jgi:hypothetical protein